MALYSPDVGAAYQTEMLAVDQIRTVALGVVDRGHRLPQRTDIRSERHDAAQHRGDRPDREILVESEQAEQHDEQQYAAAADRQLGRQDDLSAAPGDLT